MSTFHLYTSNGFKSSHRTLKAASRAADLAARNKCTQVRVVECLSGASTLGSERPAYVPGFVVLAGGSLGIFGHARTRGEANRIARQAKAQGLTGEIVTETEVA